MSKHTEDIKTEFDKFASGRGPVIIVEATVISVNEADATVEVEFVSGAVIDDARLRSVVKAGNKCILVPEVDSVVLVGRIGNSEEWVVVAVESIAKVLYVIGTATFEITEDGFLIQKGTDTLKAVLNDLVDKVKALNEEVQKIVVVVGVTADVPALQAINTALETVRTNMNNILR
jgi:hypothetical protein